MNNSLCDCISHYSQKVSLTPKTSNQCDPICVCPMKIFQISGHRKKILDLLCHRVYIQNFRQSWKISVEPWLSGLFFKFSWQNISFLGQNGNAWGPSLPGRIYGALIATEITTEAILHRGGISVSPFINMGKFEVPMVLGPPLSGTQVFRVTS